MGDVWCVVLRVCGAHADRLVRACSFAPWPFTPKEGSFVTVNSLDLRQCARYAVDKLVEAFRAEDKDRTLGRITVGNTIVEGLEELETHVRNTFSELTAEKNPKRNVSRWCVGSCCVHVRLFTQHAPPPFQTGTSSNPGD